MLRIALTGNIGAGKSTVSALLHSWGATVIDADQLVREVQKAGSLTLAAMASRFGSEILKKNGSLNRPRLREIVLADAAARRDLEALVHPVVQQLRLARETAARKRGVKILIHEIPLLFEALDPAAFDRVVLVDAPEPLRLTRLISSRNLPEPQARALIDHYDYGMLYTPPSERGVIQLPGIVGGASWAGAALDPESSMLFVP